MRISKVKAALLLIAALAGQSTNCSADSLPALPSATTRPAVDTAYATLVEQLGADHPAARDRAEAALMSAGQRARPAVLAGMDATAPEIRARCAQLLERLPWSEASDPPQDAALLNEYGLKSSYERVSLFRAAGIQFSIPTLIRLLDQDQDAFVRWSIAAAIAARHGWDIDDIGRVASGQNRPATALLGIGRLRTDPRSAETLLRQSIGIDAGDKPTPTREMGFAVAALSNLYLRTHRPSDAADLQRVWINTFGRGDPRDVRPAVFELFALHAMYGPLPGFADDMRAHRDQLSRPVLMYALARMWRLNGQPAVADILRRQAAAAAWQDPVEHNNAAALLLEHDWFDEAELEYNAVISGPNAGDVLISNAHFALARVAAVRDDDQKVADELQRGIDLARRSNGQIIGAADRDIATEIAWRRFRAARKSGKRSDSIMLLGVLGSLAPTKVQMVEDIVPELKKIGNPVLAVRLYNAAAAPLRKALAAAPNSAELNNNLAWLSARCGENLDESLKLAAHANQLSPDNAGYLDTLAECQFRLGDRSGAIATEKRAIALMPDTPFLHEQLARFQKE